MFRRTFGKSGIAVFLCLILLMGSMFGGCAKNSAKDDMPQSGGDMSSPESGYDQGGIVGESGDGERLPLTDSNGIKEKEAPFLHGENIKLIYTASISLQTIDFEKAELQFAELVKASEGYFEASYVDRGSYYSEANYIYGSYTVRIPQKNYETFLAAVGATSHVVSLNKNVQDIGIEYFDTETRLKTLHSKFDRLTALFKDATQMSDIITIENALADTQYEIDSYTSTLNRYDSLIGYSTINVSLEQVSRLDSGVDEDEGFFASLIRNLVNGFNNFVDGISNLAMWIAYNILNLVVLAGLFILGRKWYVKRKKEKGPLFSGNPIKKFMAKFKRTDKKDKSKNNEDDKKEDKEDNKTE